MQRVKDMIAALNAMLEADARGDHTQADFDRFMEEYGDFFPDHPGDLEQLVDSLARRIAAAQRLLDSLSDEQRSELAGLMSQTLDDAGLAARWPAWPMRCAPAAPSWTPWPGRASPMTGDEPLGLGDATTALAELADLAELESALRQDYPGARLDDIDEEAVRRALGRQAVDDMSALQADRARAGAAGIPAVRGRLAGADPEGGAQAGRDRAAPGVRPARRRWPG